MVSTRPPTSNSSSPFSNPLVTVPNTPITIGIIVTCMFHSFFNSLARSRYLTFFSYSFSFILWSAGTAKSTILQVLFLFFCWLLLGVFIIIVIIIIILHFASFNRWQQVSFDLKDPSEYSDWSQQCCGLDSLNSFTDFKFLHYFF